MPRIALVDDEKNIRDVIRMALEKEFLAADEYGDGLAAWEAWRLSGTMPDLVVLDIAMPRMDGIELCKRIRAAGSAVPVIFLSSREEEIDRILGLESGGDDYVCKPFSLRELLARIRAGLRRAGELPVRSGAFAAENRRASGESRADLALDEERFTAVWKGKALDLTVTEFRILRTLSFPPGFIKTREQLMAAAFPEDSYPNDKAADSHIKRIRKKFLALDPRFGELEAIYGLGYRWRDLRPEPPGKDR
ncbi:MAG: response regulator transcription factor [Treponema sp.]|jgi:DNA-binding response OmpR family regulator|nr:response regulator transcription factor [Treponema sp.]